MKLALFSSPVAHGTAVTFQWTCLCYGFAKPLPPTFLCYGFAKSIQYASPCCCMCESLIRPIRTHYTSYNHTVVGAPDPICDNIWFKHIEHNTTHFRPNPVALCPEHDLAISHSHQYISMTVLQGAQSMGNLRYRNLQRIEFST